MRAGFFVREPDGTVNPTRSYLEFTFPDRLPAVFDHRGDHRGLFAERKAPEHRGTQRLTETPAPAAQDIHARRYPPTSAAALSSMATLFGEPDTAPELAGVGQPGLMKSPSAKKWFWSAAAIIVIAALAAAGARYLSVRPTNETIALGVLERDGQLDIEWNRAAAPVAKAVHGALEITDGPQTRTIPLRPSELALGKFSYTRASGDIQVRMSVEAANGKKVQEGSRYLGPAPSKKDAEELKALQQRRKELEAEVARLKQSNNQQAQRIQQLERTLKIMQTRPGVNE
jgi:hypothetical protein